MTGRKTRFQTTQIPLVSLITAFGDPRSVQTLAGIFIQRQHVPHTWEMSASLAIGCPSGSVPLTKKTEIFYNFLDRMSGKRLGLYQFWQSPLSGYLNPRPLMHA
jgi:hypothetical protein